ncbi:putative NADPH-quinone reductase [Pseudomonas duriflava]|uniref:Putative NADPH-quinone reductase n=1 Tax=Pseudomonas duriflava TaxID=459528 RepID=A0A562QAZ0_9PSED|nr:NAD(P)H-dependent oxidoreductase [Pseudomonas duriflava]TWI53350.1 putative NADPH-quinone reductase [Pseudomonas duriflava]
MAEVRSGATPLEGDGKRILVVYGNPKNDSFCQALCAAYIQGARQQNHIVRELKLGEMTFDPVLRQGFDQSQLLEDDLLDAQRQIHWAEHLVFVYPIWWSGLPALLSGFIERVFLPGFAFAYRDQTWGGEQLLTGRTADLIMTADSLPTPWKRLRGLSPHRLMMREILDACGITINHQLELAPVRASEEEQRLRWLQDIEKLGTQA